MKFEIFSTYFQKNTQILNFKKILPVVVPCGQTDKHEEVNICFLQFCTHPKTAYIPVFRFLENREGFPSILQLFHSDLQQFGLHFPIYESHTGQDQEVCWPQNTHNNSDHKLHNIHGCPCCLRTSSLPGRVYNGVSIC